MSNVTEHDAKEKRKSDDSENSGVDFAVAWNSIHVNYILKDLHNFIVFILRRWNQLLKSNFFYLHLALYGRLQVNL